MASRLLSVLLVALLWEVSVADQRPSLVAVLESRNLSAFVHMTTLVEDSLALQGHNRTYFIPVNAAFLADSAQGQSEFIWFGGNQSAQDDFVHGVINAHVLPRWVPSVHWQDEMVLKTVDGWPMRFNFFRDPTPFVTVNCAPVLTKDVETSDALLNEIDGVLMPVKLSLWELLNADHRFSRFISLVDDDLRDQLDDADGHLTVLAFTDDAFDSLTAEVREAIIGQDICFQDLAAEHVLPFTLCLPAIYETSYVRNVVGELIRATPQCGEKQSFVQFEQSTVREEERMATNGVLYVLDRVLLIDRAVCEFFWMPLR